LLTAEFAAMHLVRCWQILLQKSLNERGVQVRRHFEAAAAIAG
jgi:hypothetical protein